MYKLNTILLKYDCDTTIKLIKKLKELKVTLPSYCYNIGSNIFKLELKENEDKEVYRKNFKIEDFYKQRIYYYKTTINNNKVKTYQIEECIKEQMKLRSTVSKYCYEGVDTGVFFITTSQKIKRNKRNIRINKNSFRIECMKTEEINNYNTKWQIKSIQPQVQIDTKPTSELNPNQQLSIQQNKQEILESKSNDDNVTTIDEEQEESVDDENDTSLIISKKKVTNRNEFSKLIIENADKITAKANPKPKQANANSKVINKLPTPIESVLPQQVTNLVEEKK